MASSNPPRGPIKGRGTLLRPPNPYQTVAQFADFEHVAADEEFFTAYDKPQTVYLPDSSGTVVAENDSPDIGFRYSLNPYRGCSHGCSYCYARTSHEYLSMNAGIDFETKVMVKFEAPKLFRDFLARPSWKPEWVSFSGITDCYQPAERNFQLTRGCIEVAAECRQPIGIVTKNALVTRDIDLLSELAKYQAVGVFLSITTLDRNLARDMEPRTSTPAARLRTIEQLSEAGVKTGVMVAPIIPGLNESEIPTILSAARQAGATSASYIMLRLSSTVRPIFLDWLQRTIPTHADRIQSRIRSVRDGKLNDSTFGNRHTGTGIIAEQIASTFRVFAKKLGYLEKPEPLRTDRFRAPTPSSGQLRLFS